MNRRIIHKLVLSVLLVTACSQGGQDKNPNNNNPDVDMAMPDGGVIVGGDGGGTAGGDGGGGGKADMTVLTGIPCTPGSYRCGASSAVEICNSSGTAWLYNATCTVSCTAGLCTGACNPGDKRCNGKNVETCNPTGSAYMLTEACTTFCESAVCAIPSLDVSSNKMLDGDQLVDGDIIIRSGATLTSPAGNLTLRTHGAVLVETGASIVVNPTGRTADGLGANCGSASAAYSGSGGGYGTQGGTGYYTGGSAWGSTTDISVQPGSAGGTGYYSTNLGGLGGGVLRLIAGKSITVAGQVTANGGNGVAPSGGSSGGGGSGGGILIATPDKVIVSGSVAASGGSPSTGGGTGGLGRVKVLSGGGQTVTGTINATQTTGLLPPTQIASSSHPNPALTYNDASPAFLASWNQAFTGLQGYYYKVSQSASDPPGPGRGMLVTTESVTIAATDLKSGANYLHLVPVDSKSTVGTVENTFQITINSAPPTLSSSTHPSQTTWYAIRDAFFNWSYPAAEANFKGVYYVLDHYGETIPTSSGTLIPVSQKGLLIGGLADGLWVMHMVPIDQQNYLTSKASHYRVQVGADPGTGTLLGQVVDAMGKGVPNAKVSVNRGLWSMTTLANGGYNFMTQIPAGSWEIRATSADGLLADVKTDVVTKGGTTTVNLTLK